MDALLGIYKHFSFFYCLSSKNLCKITNWTKKMVMKRFVFPHMLVEAPDNSSAWRLKEGRELCPSNLWWPLRSTTRKQQKADSTVFPLFFCVFSRAHMTTRNKVRHHTAQTTTYLRTAVTFLLAQAQRQESTNSRSILITPVENQEGVWLSKKVLLVQLVGAQLHGCNVLREQTDRFFFFLHSCQSQSYLDEETGLITDVTGDAIKKKTSLLMAMQMRMGTAEEPGVEMV